MAEAAPCVDKIVNSDAPVLSKESKLECDSYHTWPSKVSPVRGETQSSVEKCSSLDTVQQQDPATTQPMTMEAALASLNISYSPASRCLQEAAPAPAPAPAAVEEDGEAEAQYSYYKPGHRKAYSLPRTLEGVAEDGSIARPRLEHDCAVESPRTTLQRYGLAYQPYNFQQQRGPAEDAVSEVSEAGVSGVSDLSSLGDSGVFSEASDRTRLKKGFGEMLSKGFAANLKLLSKSGQQMVRLVRKDAGEPEAGPCAASSQSLIMEARPPGVPAKSAQEEEKHRAEHRQLLEKLRRREQSEVRSRAGRLQQQRRAEDDLSQLTSHWQTAVLPHWSPSLAASKKVQALWWRGLPPPVRGRVWRLGLANTLNLSPQLFSILVTRAREQLAASPALSSCLSREETLELVRLDVSRTFPQLCIFQPGGPYCQLLHNVLGAYVCYRPDIGYVQVGSWGHTLTIFFTLLTFYTFPGNVFHRGHPDPEPGRGGRLHHVRQPAQLAAAGRILHGGPGPGQQRCHVQCDTSVK